MDVLVISTVNNVELAKEIFDKNRSKFPSTTNFIFVNELNLIEKSNKKDLTFSMKLNYGLNLVESDYVLLLLDDFIIMESVSLSPVLRFIDAVNPDYVRLSNRPKNGTRILKFNQFTATTFTNSYQFSTQPSVWKVASLTRISDSEIDPWKLESEYQFKYRHLNFSTYGSVHGHIKYVELIKAGKYLRMRGWYSGLRRNHVNPETFTKECIIIVRGWFNYLMFHVGIFK